MTDIRIETERLLIRRFQPSDGVDFAEILTDPEVCFFEPYDVFTYDAAVAEAAVLAADESFYAVILKSSGKLIGKLYFKNMNFFDTYEVGYTFNRHFWGMGYATEATHAIVHHAFTEIGVRRLYAEADIQNVRSCRILEKIGMRREGVHLKSAAFQTTADGELIWSDYCSYAMLCEE